ncbi:MAG: GIY-YIG nuclease family protein [Chitinivibrionales bacterium]
MGDPNANIYRLRDEYTVCFYVAATRQSRRTDFIDWTNIMGTPLSRLPVMVFDCQATGAVPGRDTLLELGWGRMPKGAGGEADLNSALILPPADFSVPVRISRITGIDDQLLAGGDSVDELWRTLRHTARSCRLDPHGGCVGVVHYTRFESPWLQWLENQGRRKRKPLFDTLICTHTLARRLLPGLPRKGLRAVAGYFGYPVDQLRRSRHHAAATAEIWRHFCDMLDRDWDIRTLNALLDWTAKPVPSKPKARIFLLDRALLSDVPTGPGVYRMVRPDGEVLYVGKSRSLRQRVRSYFTNRGGHGEHILEMLSQVGDVTWQECSSAFQAALTECDQIKALSPPYNRALRADGRKVVFVSDDLRFAGESQTPRLCLGPFPAHRLFHSLVCIRTLLLRRRLYERDYTRFLETVFPETSHIPGREAFREGIRLFAEAFPQVAQLDFSSDDCWELGKALWLERIAEKENDSDENSDAESENQEISDRSDDCPIEPVQWEWDAPALCRMLSGVLLRATHHMRRQRWFAQLSESTILWQASGDRTRLHSLSFRKGHLHGSDIFNEPFTFYKYVPLKWQRSLQSRRGCLDVMTFDRLRVATSEIRRILAEGREVTIVLGPDVVLNSSRIEEILFWL